MYRFSQLILFVGFVAGVANAATPWGTSWGESFDSLTERFPNAEYLDTSTTFSWCKGSTSAHCKMRQIILRQNIANLPSKVILEFAEDATHNGILIGVSEAEKYSPKRLAIAFDQIKSLMTSGNGKPIGDTGFKLIRKDPTPLRKVWMDGHGTAVWHTKDSIISVDLAVHGAESEMVPTGRPNSSMLYIRYAPLQLISKPY